MGNPSDCVETPLTGGYLLIVLAEPRSAEHKLAILKKLTKGLSSWNYEESGVDIVTEFNAIVNQNIEGEEGKNGEQLFQYASDNLVAEILINPQHSTLVQCIRNLLASFTKYRCIIHAGYSFTENGTWILQDGSFSVADFLDAYKTAEAQRTIRLHENQIRTELYCSADADWNQVSRVKGTRFLINPAEKIVNNESIESIVRWLCDKIEVAELDILLEGSQVVGNIRFSRPTLYVFPAGQGDSALFGINGFNMLIDGGAGRNSCFWGFARHLDRLDAVLLTRLNSTNLEGVASFLKRKTMSSLYPQIGHFFCNFKTRKQISSPNVEAKQDILSISLIDTAQSIITDLKQLQLRPHLCYRNINLEPINLYHKVGHGKLDMYVLNPSKDSKEVKDFLAKWNEGDQKLFNSTKDLQFPLPNIISVCTLLVWQPANPNTTITRILFPGSSPQNKIFESLERVRHLDFLKHPSCSIKSMSSSTSVSVKSQTTKKTVLEKMIPGETKTVKTMENFELSTSASNTVIQTAIIPTVPKEGTPKPKFTVETEKPKSNIKSVIKETANAKPKIDHKYSSISAKVNSNKVIQKSSITKKSLKLSSKSPTTDKSSPTTPIENKEKMPKPIKQVVKSKSTITTTKSPSSTPTKSKKEEVNRKVLVSSRTNSGLKRTQITKKETKSTNPKFTETSLKRDSNIVYKSSLISCNKDKSGEEEDILIVEKVAITPEKLLTPDGKKIIANELDGIITTAKDIVTKEKLSDSGATTAPTMPEDEKITESKKEIEVNESDKKNEEFKKAKDALKTPDEVADLPFHEEADEQKLKVAKKEIETENETQEIVQVENAEYVLVSLDSSPEVLKRQVLDTVDLSDTEIDEDSDKEDECEETKQNIVLSDIDEKTKLIEHLFESSKDLCEITDKIDELKKQNEHEITNHQIHDHLQNSNHDNTKKSNICSRSHKQEKPTQFQEETKCELQEKELLKEEQLNIDNKNDKDLSESGHIEYNTEKRENIEDLKQVTKTQETDAKLENLENKIIHLTTTNSNSPKSNQDGTKISKRQELESISTNLSVHEDLNIVNTQQKSEFQISSDPKCDHQKEKTTDEIKTKENKGSNRSISDCEEHKNTHTTKSSSKTTYDEPLNLQEPHFNTDKSSLSSPYQEQKITNITMDTKDLKESSKSGIVCDEPVKSPVHETISSGNVGSSRSDSITEEREITKEINIESQESKISSKTHSVCDEPIQSPVQETITTNTVQSRSGSETENQENIPDNVTDIQKSKVSSKSGSICDEPVKSPVHETITTTSTVQSRSDSVTEERDITKEITIERQGSKESSIGETVKSPVHETITSANAAQSKSDSVIENHECVQGDITDMQKSKLSSKASSICDEPVKSPVNEVIKTANTVSSRSGSITEKTEYIPDNITDIQKSKTSSKASSICDEPVESPVHEAINTDNAVSSRSDSITEKIEYIPKNVTDTQKSKTSSRASSVCDEPVKSPVNEVIKTANTVSSRSGSITEKTEYIPDNITDIQKSKTSSKASSICDEPVESPVHEAINTDNAVSSRSDSITEKIEYIPKNVTDTQKSKTSSRASSVCDETIKSSALETIISANAVQSRTGSMTDEPKIITDNIIDMQKSKASSKSSSISEEHVKYPLHETITIAHTVSSRSGSVTKEREITKEITIGSQETIISANAVQSRSGSIIDEHEIIPDNVTVTQKSKTSSKASSICDESVESPVHETITSTNSVQSRSDSVTEERDITTEITIQSQESKTSSKTHSICDEPIKFPVHETITSTNTVQSRSGSIIDEQEIVPDNVTVTQKTKTSSKDSSICDEPVKSPVHETITSTNTIQSRSGSIIDEHKIIPDNEIDTQKSKTSSKDSSICDEPVKSPVHETITSTNSVQSRSDSVTEERDITNEITIQSQESKTSSKTHSICDEPIKSSVHETITSANTIQSRSGSIIDEQEIVPDNVTVTQKSKTSSKASSICDEPVESLVHETITSTNSVQSRSDSVTEEQDITKEFTIQSQESKTSSKTHLICDEPIKSPVHETITSTNSVQSRSDSVTEEQDITKEFTIQSQESKTSSKTHSICDEPIKSPVHETITSANTIQSRSGSIIDEHEIIPDNVIDTQKYKTSSKASSICDEPVESLVHETITSTNSVQSRSDSVTEERDITNEITIQSQESKTSSKTHLICDEPIKSPVHETITSTNTVQSRSGSIIDEQEIVPDNVTVTQKSKTSSKVSSICDEPVESPVHETITSTNSVQSRSDSVTEERDITKEFTIQSQESKTSSKTHSICDEPIKSPVHETITSANTIQSRSGSIIDEHEIIPDNVIDTQKYKTSSKASSICDEPVESLVHETITSTNSVQSRSDSVTEERDITNEITIQSQESKTSSKTHLICDEPIKSPVHETITSTNTVQSRSGSIIDEQEIVPDNVTVTQKSKTSSKVSSICDEPVESPVHETITSTNSVQSRSDSVTEERDITKEFTIQSQESKTSSKTHSICDEPIKSPVHETITSANTIQSRSGSIIDEHEIIPDNVIDTQKSKTSSKDSSICDEPIKSPVHETITSTNTVQSRSGSIIEERDITKEVTIESQKSKTSSKNLTHSVRDEPIKSPVQETITTNIVKSRSGSIIDEQEIVPDNVTVTQKSKTSSKASSICDESVESPVHETITSTNSAQSRSGSIIDEQEIIPDNVTVTQKSKTSSKASSICDEPVESLVHETITSTNTVQSRSGSIIEERDITKEVTIESQKSKTSSKTHSVRDEPIKSPVQETITTNIVKSRSGSIIDEQEIIPDNVTVTQKSKTSSKASSICDEPVESLVHETITSTNTVQSRSGSIIEERDITKEFTIQSQESKTSSKTHSVRDEPVKSSVHESITSANAVLSRSGSIVDEQVIIPDNVTDIQKSKTSSKDSSICDEPVKSPVHEITMLINPISSSSSSITQVSKNIPEKDTDDQLALKISSKSYSVCDELVKSPLCETTIPEDSSTNISSSITQEPKNIIDSLCSTDSSEANSISKEPLKSLELAVMDTYTSESNISLSSVNQEQDITQVFKNEDHIHKEHIKILHQEKNSNVGVISSKTNFSEELLESIPKSNNCSIIDDIISNISLKEQESISSLIKSGNSSLSQDTEYTHTIGMNKQDVEQCSIKDSFCQDKNKSSTFSSSSTSSICQDIDTQSSKLSSRKSSVVDELIDNPSKLQIGEKSSSLQESNVYEHDNDNNYKIINKSGSLCDEMLNLSFDKVTENIISNKAYEQAETTTGKTETNIANKVEFMCEKSILSQNDEICTKENLISSISSSIHHETEEEKCEIQKKISEFDEPQNFVSEDTKIILPPFDCNKNKSNVIERKTDESKSLGRIGSMCEEISKFLTDNEGKISTYITSELPCNLIESIPLKSNIEGSEVKTETFLQTNKNTDPLNKFEKSLQLDDLVKVDEKHEKNTDHSLPVENITVSNNNSPNISTLLIEENNKTGIMNVAQMVGKNVSDESLVKHSVITDNECKSLKTVSPIFNISSGECISKISNILIEDVVKTSDDKNIICDSSITDICMNQPLGVTLNSEDLGVTKDIVMQLKRDVHEALHQCSSDDERPFTPHSESSISRSAMNIDDDDDDNEDNKIETDDDIPGSPMSSGPSPIQMQLDNRHVEINMDFNKAMQEHRITRGEDLTNTEANGNHVTEIKTTEHDNINQNQSTSSDTVQSWGKPLGLPPVQSINNNGFDPIREWGKPLGLPSPTQPILELAEPQNMSSKTTPKKNVKKIIDNKPIINVMDKDAQNRIRRSESPSKLRSRSSSRMSRINPVYLDLIYVPHHGNSKYVSVDFFKRIRARNYVFSGTDPSKEVLNALIEGKQTWEDQDLEVTIIPTYDTDTLGQWVAENEELLTKLKIDLSPSASRCTIKLQDHNTSCSAYRLEF